MEGRGKSRAGKLRVILNDWDYGASGMVTLLTV
jgi:hypothetical protein